jgi:uncharacterized protein YegP (UPF0339 family)
MMEKARFEFEQGADGQHYWHLRAAGATTENEIIATGEGYSSKEAAEGGVEAVKRGVLSSLGVDTHDRIILGETRISESGDRAELLEVDSGEIRHYVRVDEDAQLPL